MVSLWPHQIVKGQWFTTVKVRFDPGPTFPETGLGTGVGDVRGVEVGFSDDVAVIARVAILRFREQTLILVEEMGESIRAVLFRHFSQPRRLMVGVRSTAATEGDVRIAKPGSEPEKPSGIGRGGTKAEKKIIHGCISAAMVTQGKIGFGGTCIGKLNRAKSLTLPKVTHPIFSWCPCLPRP